MQENSPQEIIAMPADCSLEQFCEQAEQLADNLVGGIIARSKSARSIGRDDLMSAARLAMVEAYHGFDGSISDRVTPYLISRMRWRILEEVSMQLGQRHSSIHPRLWSKRLSMERWMAEFARENGREASLAELSERFGDGESRIKALLGASAGLSEDEAGEIADLTLNPAERAENRLTAEAVLEWIENAIGSRERDIFQQARAEEKSLQEIADGYHLTHERIRQIVKRVEKRASQRFASRGF